MRGRRERYGVVALGLAALAAAACGLTVAGSGAGLGDGGNDAPSADVAIDGAPDASGPVPPEGSAEISLDELDAGDPAGAGADADADAGPPLFEIVAPAGGKYTIYPPGAELPCSKSGPGVSLRLENHSTENVRLFWYDYDCEEVDYGKTDKTKARSYSTSVGHRWRVRRDSDDTLLGDFVINAPAATEYRAIVR